MIPRKSYIYFNRKPWPMEQRKTCYYCERVFMPKMRSGELSGIDFGDQSLQGCHRTIDHIIPESKGGRKSAPNTVEACGTCNRIKGSMLPEQFLDYLNECMGKNTFSGLRKNEFLKLVENTEKLILKVNENRAAYVWAISRENTPLQFLSKLCGTLLSDPSYKKPAQTTEQLLNKFRRVYPYAYQLMQEANPDMPRWVIDNLVGNPEFKK